MSTRHLGQLAVEIEQVNRAVDFLEAYAGTAIEGPVGASQDSSLRWGTWRNDEHGESDDEARWLGVAEGASALREASQWAMFIDTARARSLLVRAAAI